MDRSFRGIRTASLRLYFVKKGCFMKMLFPLIVATGLILSGCSGTAPKCSDDEIVSLVKEIVKEQAVRGLGARAAESLHYSLSAIRTTGVNKQTGANSCAAQLTITSKSMTFGDYMDNSSNEKEEHSITYTVEKTDKRGEFYVSVFDL